MTDTSIAASVLMSDARYIVTGCTWLGHAIIPDGYFGNTRHANIGFHKASGYTYVWEYGMDAAPFCFRTALPRCNNASEAAWYIAHPHPCIANWRNVTLAEASR